MSTNAHFEALFDGDPARVGKQTERHVILLWTDIDVIRPENLMEFVLMEESEG